MRTCLVFCITALSVSTGRARFPAARFKKLYPWSLVLVGGIHASLMPEEFIDVADHDFAGLSFSMQLLFCHPDIRP